MESVYLDYNATTPVAKEVSEAIMTALTDAWGNPSSSHEIGAKAKHMIETSRQHIARMLKVPVSSIVFTSGGTESNNIIIHSAVEFYLKATARVFNMNSCSTIPHIITCNIEHDSVLKPLEHMLSEGLITLSVLPVSKITGCVDIELIMACIREETCLVTVMMANNETGLIQPIAELGARLFAINRARKIPVLFHTDAAQTIGKVEVSVKDLRVHYLTIVGHKFYGPRISAIYVKNLMNESSLLSPIVFGGGQERGFRAGTENTPMIVGLGRAAELVIDHLDEYEKHMLSMCTLLEKKLKEAFGDKVKFNNVRTNVPRLPNTTSVSFLFGKVTGSKILSQCSSICASTGAACHGTGSVSNILINSGVTEYCAERTLRLSVGRETMKSDVEFCVDKLKLAISELVSE